MVSEMPNSILVLLAFIAPAVIIFLGIFIFFSYQCSKKNHFLLIQTVKHIREGFILVDENNNYLLSNPAAARIFPEISKLARGDSIFLINGWPEELKELETSSIEFSTSEENKPLESDQPEIHLRYQKYFKASVSQVFTDNQMLIARIILLSDVTGNVNLLNKLKDAAYMDALTGLYSRKHFFELAAIEIERAQRLNQPVYAAMLDLDFFKKVNDTYGHAAGDMVLKTAAEVIQKSIRTYDLLGRYGGEEFVILFTNLVASELHFPSERIRENMEHNVTNYEGQEIKITCSIGMARFLEDDTLEATLKKADAALYAAKRAGRNQVQIYDSLVEG
jgi:diguanylate cyclase (GGDEF)-like protein